MKSASYILIMILLIGTASLFYLKRPDGQSWLSVEAITDKASAKLETNMQGAKALLNETTELVQSKFDAKSEIENTAKIYKWQDAQGVWHYSDRPHPTYQNEEVILDPNKITVIDAEDTAILQLESNLKQEPNDSDPIGITTISPESVEQLLKDANKVQKLMDDREKQLNEQIDH
ncbi:putative orphan protein [Pseudoalteromonas luteoviolacea B = ATCC 29581]|nr:putative orphan protein [Pseudoalteromonas luteoviolacea B = ATCC 29581]